MDDEVQYILNKYQDLLDNEFSLLNDTTEFEARTIVSLMHELKERRAKDCEHEIFSIKNEKIDSGFMCAKCKLVFRQYFGTLNLEKEE